MAIQINGYHVESKVKELVMVMEQEEGITNQQAVAVTINTTTKIVDEYI